MNRFQLIEFSLLKFDRLENIQQFYQLTSCLLKKQRKNEVTIVFWFFHTPKNKFFFSKTLKISAPNSFFPKNDKNLLFNGGLFQQVLLTWNDNLVQETRRLKSKIEFEDWFRRWGNSWTFWCSTKKNFKVGKDAQVENLPLVICFFCASVDVGHF